eukprot:9409400-Ditylum_brightwellii.AAC.1
MKEKKGFRGRKEARKANIEAREKYVELKQAGVDSVSNTKESIAIRAYEMRKKKKKFILKKEKSLSAVLFPGVSPVEYEHGELVPIFAELVESHKTQVPYSYYSRNLPFCPRPNPAHARKAKRKNLGAKLQGARTELSPYDLTVLEDTPCTAICEVPLRADSRQLAYL